MTQSEEINPSAPYGLLAEHMPLVIFILALAIALAQEAWG